MSKLKIIDSGAKFSDDNVHRYSLWRTWNYDQPRIMFIGLNPSRADAVKNDPTITRCINFANSWGYGSLYFANLFSFRTPYVYPKHKNISVNLFDIEEQWGCLTENMEIAYNLSTNLYLKDMIKASEKIVACWGAWPFINDRANDVLQLIYGTAKMPSCFSKTKGGYPGHPLYLPGNTVLQEY